MSRKNKYVPVFNNQFSIRFLPNFFSTIQEYSFKINFTHRPSCVDVKHVVKNNSSQQTNCGLFEVIKEK